MNLRAKITNQPWRERRWRPEQQIQNTESSTTGLLAGSIYFERLHAHVKQMNSKEYN